MTGIIYKSNIFASNYIEGELYMEDVKKDEVKLDTKVTSKKNLIIMFILGIAFGLVLSHALKINVNVGAHVVNSSKVVASESAKLVSVASTTQPVAPAKVITKKVIVPDGTVSPAAVPINGK